MSSLDRCNVSKLKVGSVKKNPDKDFFQKCFRVIFQTFKMISSYLLYFNKRVKKKCIKMSYRMISPSNLN